MNDSQEHEEQARKVDQFHDRYHHQKSPDWLKAEAEAEVKATAKTHTYDLGRHTVEIDEQGTLVMDAAGTRMVLSADEAYRLLVALHDNHREMLYKLTHQNQDTEPAAKSVEATYKCLVVGCTNRVPSPGGFCEEHQDQEQVEPETFAQG